MATIKADTKFPTTLVTEMFSKVQGHSALAKIAAETPIPFNGITEMIFNAEGEAQLVGEGEKKEPGNGTVEPKVIRPVKFVYQMRVSDEFLKASDEDRLQYLRAFGDGFAKKIARGFDIAAIHGLEPRTLAAASFKDTNSFDGTVTNKETYAAATIDENIDAAIAKIDGGQATGIALSTEAGTALSKIKVNGVPQYPEYRFGQNPDAFYGMKSDVNSTVSVAASGGDKDHVVVGDFSAFKWGYATNIPLDVIRYGDPDGTGKDLKAYNEVCLRAEAYIGWGILDPSKFALVQE